MRGRCAVRNHGHKARVVSSDGDRSQLREGGTPRVLAASRNMAVGSMRLTGRRDLAQAGRRYAGRPARAPSLVGSRMTKLPCRNRASWQWRARGDACCRRPVCWRACTGPSSMLRSRRPLGNSLGRSRASRPWRSRRVCGGCRCRVRRIGNPGSEREDGRAGLAGWRAWDRMPRTRCG